MLKEHSMTFNACLFECLRRCVSQAQTVLPAAVLFCFLFVLDFLKSPKKISVFQNAFNHAIEGLSSNIQLKMINLRLYLVYIDILKGQIS